MHNDTKDARSALHAIPPGLPHDEWVRAGMGAHAAGLSLEDFDEWSSAGPSYNERDTRNTWRSFGAGAIGAGTLFMMAANHGWPGADASTRPYRVAQQKGLGTSPASAKAPRPGMSAAEVWGRCKPASAEHGYIVAKQGTPHGVRVVPDGDALIINGQSLVGWLVVPVVPLLGVEPVSLQFIPPPGGGAKLNLPGASMDGVFVVGDLQTSVVVQVCEGIGQAWACSKASGTASVVCFGWGRVKSVVAELRAADSEAQIVIVPDKGKEVEAEAIARQVSGVFVAMPEGAPTNYDANDYAAGHGDNALKVLLTAARAPSCRFPMLRSEDIRGMPPLAWRVHGVFPAQGLAAIYGASGSGKSFLALDVAAAISEGKPWFGYQVVTAPVVYVALEGTAGFRQRVLAWEQHNGRALPDRMYLVVAPFKLTQKVDVDDLASAVRAVAGDGAVIIIDTLNRAAPDADENSSAHMGSILEAAKQLQQRVAGLVVLVHHTGKDESSGLRGHSSLVAALDASVLVKRKEGGRSWTTPKVKDGRDGAVHPFHLHEIALPVGPDGEAITSCVVQSADIGPQTKRVKEVRVPRGANQKIAMDALRPLFDASNVLAFSGKGARRGSIDLEVAIMTVSKAMPCEPDRRTTRARESINGLLAGNYLVCQEGVLTWA